jgi:hypothetical protein
MVMVNFNSFNCRVFGIMSYIVLMSIGQQMEHELAKGVGQENVFICSLQLCVFSLYLAVFSLPIHFCKHFICNHSH